MCTKADHVQALLEQNQLQKHLLLAALEMWNKLEHPDKFEFKIVPIRLRWTGEQRFAYQGQYRGTHFMGGPFKTGEEAFHHAMETLQKNAPR